MPTKHYLAIAVLAAMGGCTSGISPDERDRIAVAYAEALMARQSHPGDSLATARAVDSVLKAFGYSRASDLADDMKRAAEQAEQFRALLDSSQHYMERIRSGTEPKTPADLDTTKGADQPR